VVHSDARRDRAERREIKTTVLFLGAVGDRYGRNKMLVLGAALCIPFNAAARAFTEGKSLAILMASGSVLIGLFTVWWKYPRGRSRTRLLRADPRRRGRGGQCKLTAEDVFVVVIVAKSQVAQACLANASRTS
jgi:hypothetical protein